jgi:hypothetical protein
MSPTLFRAHGYRFFFFSREETRMHVHVAHAEGEAKFWLEPEIELARYIGLNARALKEVEGLVQEHAQEIKDAWRHHFPR